MPKRRASTPPVAENDAVSLLPSQRKKAKGSSHKPAVCFVGKPIPVTEACAKWPHRYPSQGKKKDARNISKEATNDNNEVMLAKCHYRQAEIDGTVFNLDDDAYVKAEDGKPDYIARIVEIFETVDNEPYFMARWFYRAEDTVIKGHCDLVDKKRVFLSDVKDENPLDCIVSKVKIVKLTPNVSLTVEKRKIPPCDYYYDMKYTLPYLTFSNIVDETDKSESDASSTVSSEGGSSDCSNDNPTNGKTIEKNSSNSSEWALLDLYSGCGAMSTGLCLGATLAEVKLVTRWAVDINSYACKSLKQNHPETQVRNEPAENFLELIKAWAKLCEEFGLLGSERSESGSDMEEDENDEETMDVKKEESEEDHSDSEDFEVEKLLAICHGDPNNVKKPGLYFKVRWMGYDSSYDTWEPIDGLSDCKDALKDFVTKGYKKKLLPLPGDAHFICGGPPCQGVSGFNRFRNAAAPLEDIKNKQLIVYMDIIDFLKPKYVLMENVVDILKFSGGYLGRYAIGRLVAMNYQARMGMMAAGSYGVPQFRMRVFLWGARPTEKLPPYPLPTHEVVSRGFVPTEFEEITVAYDNKDTCKLGDALLLEDALSDLPPVTNDEKQDERNYGTAARTEFQKYIRLKKSELVGGNKSSTQSTARRILYDHRPLQLNQDDYDRVCRIPQKKGANFRDLPGVIVKDNKVEWDPLIERVMLDSGKPLVPDYAMSFVRGTSSKPFGRLWWDEIVPTVVTRAEPHNQVILHPNQNRVLTIRENARLQGFPDCYKLCGPIKERYMQVGNAVAVPVALAMGYTFGLACQGLSDDKPLITLPFKYPSCLAGATFAETENDDDQSS
ncbi:putative DNA (cytosine-5)-methyltransferase CMT1 isoform X1 [Vigna radiata var. radiata]|uniref:DNA (cytosine-5-)-methyltransferase n=1 Tax=Vigna radiata var. radiata TaxID=3916 RepID=A0A1S3VTB9_VIGRR|nr:putative DNA (cytosine-5)-methyltransferase CMT1 isoform X1 [Vigna radiata var. radiata]